MSTAVAAFDFDGTITRSDTLGPFLRAVAGRAGVARAGAACLPLIRERDAGRRRDRAKTAMLSSVFGGRECGPVEALAGAYAASLPTRYRSEVVALVDDHRRRGHRLVLVSASLALYARPAALALGFDDVIAVELRHEGGRFTGAMDGPNVRGAEKAIRLRALIGSDCDEIWAYGNSAGDHELLAMADHPGWVGRPGGRPSPPRA